MIKAILFAMGAFATLSLVAFAEPHQVRENDRIILVYKVGAKQAVAIHRVWNENEKVFYHYVVADYNHNGCHYQRVLSRRLENDAPEL